MHSKTGKGVLSICSVLLCIHYRKSSCSLTMLKTKLDQDAAVDNSVPMHSDLYAAILLRYCGCAGKCVARKARKRTLNVLRSTDFCLSS